MSLDIFSPYPGAKLALTSRGSILFGAPSDAFKATKYFCNQHSIPFPRILVAPQTLLVAATPQFSPEFFLYEFLFVYGAAFNRRLENERLVLVCDPEQRDGIKRALEITLYGPSLAQMQSYRDPQGKRLVPDDIATILANISRHLAVKKDNRQCEINESVDIVCFDRSGKIQLLDDSVHIARTAPHEFLIRTQNKTQPIDLSIHGPVTPFATLKTPSITQTPITFGIKALGTRSGFDLSGPTTGFLFWINGRAVVYDGPVGTRYLLQSQGISCDDIDAIILSHCHEDHMGAFVELILAGQRPKVITAEPIYRSALAKLACHFGESEEDVAGYIDYQRVTPGEPFEMLGAEFNFFYTAHSIPTIGVHVAMNDGGGHKHSIQVSGDTIHHAGLDEMLQCGILNQNMFQSLRNLIPSKRIENSTYFADVGESIIHGHPKDWEGNPNDILYYHCPDNAHTRSFGHRLAEPGQLITHITPRPLHPAIPARLLRALKFLEVDDPAWFSAMLFKGKTRTISSQSILAHEGEQDPRSMFSIIVSGIASVWNSHNEKITELRPGEFFGHIELVDARGHNTATITAETPMELFEINGSFLDEYFHAKGLEKKIRTIWEHRPMVGSAELFRHLDLSVRNQIAAYGDKVQFEKNHTVIQQGEIGDDFYLLCEGTVSVIVDGDIMSTIAHTDDDNFFGEIAAIHPGRTRRATIYTTTPCVCLRLSGNIMRTLFSKYAGIHYTIKISIESRLRK